MKKNLRLLPTVIVLILSFVIIIKAQDNIQRNQLFNNDWKFFLGDSPSANTIDFDDRTWRNLDLPHDWSIEGNSRSDKKDNSKIEFPVVKGEWKFSKGDNLHWKDADFDDKSWQVVTLPSTWEKHSNYTQDNVFGWYRRELFIPAELKGKDVYINLGKIDDADETYFDGVKVGGLGFFPPHYVSAWDNFRYYKVPHEIIKYGEKSVIAVRVFDGIQGGGIYYDGERVTEGPFDSGSAGGSGAGFINGGIGWYRKEFKLPESNRGKRVFIEFDGVYMNSDVWINNVHIGNRPYGYSSFQYELTNHLKYGNEKNVLAVKVDVQQPCSRWYSGAGIYRNVRLIITNPVHIAHWGTFVTTPIISDKETTVCIETKIQNQSSTSEQVQLENIIFDNRGREVSKNSLLQKVIADSITIFKQLIKIPKPKIWSIENPSLYHIKTRVSINNQTVDESETVFGIRSFEFTADKGFFLNGKHVDIKGVCLHHDLGCLGSAVNTRAIERQLEIMKSLGCNAIRTSHNPPAPELLDLCDRMGFLVMDEAFDEWIRSKTMYGYGQFFDEWSERDVTEMIRRDRNHPSIILWSVGNEIPEQDNSNAYEMSKRLVDICHKEDSTRPVTSACNTPDAAVKTGFSKPLDVFGINYSIPFYQVMKGEAKLVGSETTSAVTTRGEYNLVLDNGIVTIKSELNNQCSSYNDTTAEYTLRAFKNLPNVAGQFLWTGFDYIGEPSPFSWPSVSSYFGIVDLCGFPKDRFYLYQSQWTDKPMVHILPHWNWQGFEEKEIPVWCYSNCESVELFFNGKSLGEKKFINTNNLHLAWNVPYSSGTLKAVAKNNGKIICTDEIKTAGEPAKIFLIPDRSEISADGEDLSYVKIEIVDKDGNICPNADNLVKFTLKGEGKIAGVGNGNPISHEYFKASERKTFHGLALVIIQSTYASGEIFLQATSDGLIESAITINTKK